MTAARGRHETRCIAAGDAIERRRNDPDDNGFGPFYQRIVGWGNRESYGKNAGRHWHYATELLVVHAVRGGAANLIKNQLRKVRSARA